MGGNSWMMGILKWGMAQIWSCGWVLRKSKVKTLNLFIHNRVGRAEKPGHEENLKLRTSTGVLGHPCNLWFDFLLK